MKYILDSSGYVESASCNPISCDDKVSQEYTGAIPSGYDSLDDWILNANIRAYKIVNGNLVYDEAKDEELQAEWANTFSRVDANGWTVLNFVTHKEYLKNVDTELTVAGNGWGAVEISNLPVGMTELGDRNLTYAGGCLDNAVDISVLTPRDWGSIWIGYRNKYNGQVTGGVNICLRILELPEVY